MVARDRAAALSNFQALSSATSVPWPPKVARDTSPRRASLRPRFEPSSTTLTLPLPLFVAIPIKILAATLAREPEIAILAALRAAHSLRLQRPHRRREPAPALGAPLPRPLAVTHGTAAFSRPSDPRELLATARPATGPRPHPPSALRDHRQRDHRQRRARGQPLTRQLGHSLPIAVTERRHRDQ